MIGGGRFGQIGGTRLLGKSRLLVRRLHQTTAAGPWGPHHTEGREQPRATVCLFVSFATCLIAFGKHAASRWAAHAPQRRLSVYPSSPLRVENFPSSGRKKAREREWNHQRRALFPLEKVVIAGLCPAPALPPPPRTLR